MGHSKQQRVIQAFRNEYIHLSQVNLQLKAAGVHRKRARKCINSGERESERARE